MPTFGAFAAPITIEQGTARSILLVMNNGTVVKLIDVHKTYRTGEVEVPAVRGVSL